MQTYLTSSTSTVGRYLYIYIYIYKYLPTVDVLDVKYVCINILYNAID